MATATVTTALPARTATPPPHLSINTSNRGTPAAIPNKHIPFCSPGPRPQSRQLDTPPQSPPSPSHHPTETTSLTHPPTAYPKASNDTYAPLYSITAQQLHRALDHLATQPLPAARHVFPWLHGLHQDNQLQLAFFTARKKSLRRLPKCIRGLTIVKAGGDLSHSKIKGAIAADELLQQCSCDIRTKSCKGCDFVEVDPREGFSVRNFQIQAAKMATVSDIVVYGDEQTPRTEVRHLAQRLARAQAAWLKRGEGASSGARLFNTFLLSDSYAIVETDHPDMIALDSEGCMTHKVVDFFHWERVEMCSMSAPTEICPNVWLGPSPDPSITFDANGDCLFRDLQFDVQIEASDLAQVPDSRSLSALEDFLDRKDFLDSQKTGDLPDSNLTDLPILEFPGSGAILPPTWSQNEVDGLMATCAWIYRQANGLPAPPPKRRDSKLSSTPELDPDGDAFMSSSTSSILPPTGRRILIHCADGYTESSLLALAYTMYAEGLPAHAAWLYLHREKRRNFFAYSSDVALLRAIQPRILQASPKHAPTPALSLTQLAPPEPEWLDRMDGSLPSRVLPYMYLGNLGHANNPGLLKELGIGRVLSVGEPVGWCAGGEGEEGWAATDLMFVEGVQDNGVDPLVEEFGRCLEFIEQGRVANTATLVHCRVGVSRSATICIAAVMDTLGLSFPRAYCYVRARRLNVIIQPHLRFCYELLKWEELQAQKRGKPLRRELEWATIAREIAAMNRPYARQ